MSAPESNQSLQPELDSSQTVVVGLDLAFADAELEREFTQSYNQSQIYYDVSTVY